MGLPKPGTQLSGTRSVTKGYEATFKAKFLQKNRILRTFDGFGKQKTISFTIF